MGHKYKEVFAAAAEVMGLAMAYMDSNLQVRQEKWGWMVESIECLQVLECIMDASTVVKFTMLVKWSFCLILSISTMVMESVWICEFLEL